MILLLNWYLFFAGAADAKKDDAGAAAADVAAEKKEDGPAPAAASAADVHKPAAQMDLDWYFFVFTWKMLRASCLLIIKAVYIKVSVKVVSALVWCVLMVKWCRGDHAMEKKISGINHTLLCVCKMQSSASDPALIKNKK